MTPTAPPEYDTLADVVRALGDVPLDRILWKPYPGTATEEDHLRLVTGEPRRRVELVDGVLVEKPMGAREAYLAFTLMGYLWTYQRTHNLGVFAAPDANMRLRAGLVRLPDIHFTSWPNLPGEPRLPAAGRRLPAGPGGRDPVRVRPAGHLCGGSYASTSPRGPSSSGSSTRWPALSKCTPTRISPTS